MLSPIIVGALIQMGIIIILCVGFTFTYMVEKFANFAHTAIATIGTIIAFHMVTIYGYNVYATWPVSMLFCGLLGVVLYVLIVRPIKATGAKEITLTFAFFAMAEVVGSLVSIYSYLLHYQVGYATNGFTLASYDFTWGGYPGVFLVTLSVCAVLVIALALFLGRVKQGIALRAVAEDEPLAASVGVNIHNIHLISWFLTGAFAGLAGAIIPLWRYTDLGYSDAFLVIVMSGCVIGGLNSVYGAVIGGFITSVAQNALGALAVALFGIAASDYDALYPMIFIIVVLMVEPNGIMGFFEKPHNPRETLHTTAFRIRGFIARLKHGV